MQRLKVTDFGSQVQGVTLKGDRRHPEPESFRVKFPGGDVDVTRTTDDEYWIHVRVNRPENTIDEDEPNGRIVDARLDIVNKHASQTKVGDFENPGLYHLAVRIAKDE
jgi:hypothetical protein